MKSFISLLMIAALAAPEGWAAERRRIPPQNTLGTRPAAGTPGTPTSDQAQSVQDLCKADPYKDLVEPKKPTTPAVDVSAEIPDDQVEKMKFDAHCRRNGNEVNDKCNLSLARAFVAFHRGKQIYKSQLKTACESLEAEQQKCNNQAESRQCAANLYKGIAQKFEEAKKKMDKDVDRLNKDNSGHITVARRLLGSPVPTGQQPPAGARFTAARYPVADRMIKEDATTGGDATTRANQETHTARCVTKVADKEFCGHITAAADTKYYAITLGKVARDTGASSITMKALADRTTNGPGGQGDPNGNKKGGLLDSVGGMDGLIKMATLGMMGAGLYCQVSGQCGNQASQNSALTPDANTGLGATSPTPSSPNNGPQSSSLGENDNSKGGSATPPGADFKTATDTNTSSENFAGGSGFSSDAPEQEALQPFQGGLDRGPASAAAPSSGGGGSGGDSSSASNPTETNAEAPKASGSSDGLGPLSGGGGLPAAGGFSLSSSPDAPAADAALKDILNGEGAPGDAGLGAMLDDPNAAGAAGVNGDIDLQDAESLFFRIRDTHVRCIKRGCVGRGVGETI